MILYLLFFTFTVAERDDPVLVAAVTTRGCTELQAKEIASLIHNYLSKNITIEVAKEKVKNIVSTWKIIEEI